MKKNTNLTNKLIRQFHLITSQHPYISICISTFICSVIAFLISTSFIITDAPPQKDGINNIAIAFNLQKYGVITRSLADKNKRPKPLLTREPLYPVFMGAVMKVCLPSETKLRTITSASKEVVCLKYGNILLLLLLICSAGFIAYKLFENFYYTAIFQLLIACNPTLLETTNRFYTELPGALCLLISSFMLTYSFKKKNIAYSVLAGFALSMLAYTKAVYFYFALLLFPLLILLIIVNLIFKTDFIKKNELPKKTAIILISFLLLITPWLVRNYSVTKGKIAFATRGSRILSIRAEYDSLNFKDQCASFIIYSRFLTNKQKIAIVGEDTYTLYERNNKNSVYRRFNTKDGNIYQFKKKHSLSDNKAALLFMAKNFHKHLFMSIAFSHRALFLNDASKSLLVLFLMGQILSFILVPAFFISLYFTWKNKDINFFLFLVLSIYSFGFHSFFTHFIRRYNDPLIPIFIISLLYCINTLVNKKIKTRK